MIKFSVSHNTLQYLFVFPVTIWVFNNTEFLEAKKDEPDIEKLLQMLQSAQKDFVVDGATLTSYQHLIQWVTNFILHMMASIPEYKQMRRGPGVRNS